MRHAVSPKSAAALLRRLQHTCQRAWPHVILYVVALYVGTLVHIYLTNEIDEPLDFTAFYSAGTLASNGRAADAYSSATLGEVVTDLFPKTEYRYLWNYPPYFSLPLELVSKMPYNVAFLVWNAVTLIFMLFAMRPLADGRAAVMIAIFPPLAINFTLGQNGFLVAGLLAVVCAQANRHPAVAGLALGALSFKPHLGVLVPLVLLMRRRLMLLAVAFVVVAILCALGYLRYGASAWIGFLNAAGATASLMREHRLPVDVMVSPLALLSNLGLAMTAATIIHAAVAAGMIVSLVVAGLRAAPLPLLLGVAITGTFLATPYSYPYDLSALAVPLALLFQDVRERGWNRGDRPVLALLYIAGFVDFFVWRSWTYPIAPISLIPFYAVLCRRVWTYGWGDDALALMRRRRRRRRG